MELPEWHETEYAPDDVVNITQIGELDGAPSAAALRSYATYRREHALLGPMPQPVARIANRRLWLKAEVEAWLHCPIEPFRRNAANVAAWIAAGRPRDAATMPDAHGESQPLRRSTGSGSAGDPASRTYELDALPLGPGGGGWAGIQGIGDLP